MAVLIAARYRSSRVCGLGPRRLCHRTLPIMLTSHCRPTRAHMRRYAVKVRPVVCMPRSATSWPIITPFHISPPRRGSKTRCTRVDRKHGEHDAAAGTSTLAVAGEVVGLGTGATTGSAGGGSTTSNTRWRPSSEGGPGWSMMVSSGGVREADSTNSLEGLPRGVATDVRRFPPSSGGMSVDLVLGVE